MKHIVTVLIAFVLTHGAVYAQVDTTATVAAWNIQDGTGNEQRASEIASGIFWLDAELIVLTEASRTDKMQGLITKLSDLGSDYTLHLPEQQSASDQIAILAKDGVQVTDVKLLAESDDNNRFLRKAITASCSIGEFDFVLVGVHLKAGRGGGDRVIRTSQCDVIAQFIDDATSETEKDVLVVGDYNMIPGSSTSRKDRDNFVAMNPDSYLYFVSSEDLVGQGTHIGSDGHMGNLLDGFAISSEHTDEYIDGSLRIFPLHRAFRTSLADYREFVSDHLPLVARFVVTVDDDE